MFIASGMDDQDEVWFLPINTSDTESYSIEPILFEPRAEGLEYSVDHQGNDADNRFIILSNADDAQDFKLSVTDCDKPGRQYWTDFQAYQPGRMIHTFEVFRDWIMWLAVENALPAIYFSGADGNVSKVAFDEEAYSLGLDAGLEYDADVFRYDYSSPTTPWQTWQYNQKTHGRRV